MPVLFDLCKGWMGQETISALTNCIVTASTCMSPAVHTKAIDL